MTDTFAFQYRRFLKKCSQYCLFWVRQSLPILLSAALVFVWLAVAYKNTAPTAAELACQVVQGQIQKLILSVASDTLDQLGTESYCSTEYGADGSILAVSSDAIALNQATKAVTANVQTALNESRTFSVPIPIGTLIGWKWTSGRGFSIRFRAEPYASVIAAVQNHLEAVGINQISHTILLTVLANVTLICMGEKKSFECTVNLTLAEEILIGKVPDGLFLNSTDS
jgi:hypothetical protein